ncbi:MAG: response regulator [Alphaproteobacteria bacterium]|nr:response regulator [Rhodospirillales bacterium]MCW9045567.1 response regulator [Alphaproteobacteria bacterium]
MVAGNNLKLLIIDENQDDCRHLVWVLSRLTYPVFFVSTLTPSELRESARQLHLWDVVLVASDNEHWSGLKILDFIRKTSPSLPTIFLTETANDDLGLTALRRGARDYLAKDELSGPSLSKLLVKTVIRSAVQRRSRGRPSKEVLEQTFSAVLDRLPMGVLLLDVDSRVIFMNGKAEKIVQNGDGLVVDEEGYCGASTHSDSAHLNRLLNNALYPGDSSDSDSHSALSLERKNEAPPLSLLVSSIGSRSSFHGAVVFIVDSEDPINVNEEALVELYGLTRVEARLVAGIASGGTLESLATKWNVSQHTLRAQLKQIFTKTETRRQSDLIKLVLTGPAVLGGKWSQPKST